MIYFSKEEAKKNVILVIMIITIILMELNSFPTFIKIFLQIFICIVGLVFVITSYSFYNNLPDSRKTGKNP